MQFEPKSKNQIIEESLLPKGDYPFTVLSATDDKSKAGNDMITVGLRVFREDGRTSIVNDWLMPDQIKLVDFCEATGLMDKYNAGTLVAADCVGRDGIVALKIADAKGDWPASNKVAKYKPAGAETPKPPAEAEKLEEADIPF